MQESRQTLHRQWALLQQIPRAPGAVGTQILMTRLKELGFQVDVRTIQRDLLSLSTVFPLSSGEEGRAGRWFWSEEARVTELPGMSVHTAIAFRLAEEHLLPLLPKTTLQHLRGHFRRAKDLLRGQASNRFGLWPDKIGMITREPALLPPPSVSSAVQAAVEQALLDDRQLEVIHEYETKHERLTWKQVRSHLKKGKPAVIYPKLAKSYVVHPWGLVLRDRVFYLIGMVKDYPYLRHLTLHTISRARVLDEVARRPKGFRLQRYIRKEQFDADLIDEYLWCGWPEILKHDRHTYDQARSGKKRLTPRDFMKIGKKSEKRQ
jgi:predicted DNA-binding transcriptional regulator YafY